MTTEMNSLMVQAKTLVSIHQSWTSEHKTWGRFGALSLIPVVHRPTVAYTMYIIASRVTGCWPHFFFRLLPSIMCEVRAGGSFNNEFPHCITLQNYPG